MRADDADTVRLGEHVETRIQELGLDYVDVARRAGFSVETLSKIRRGAVVKSATYRRLERALQWCPQSVDTIKAGGEPTLIPADEPVEADDEPVDPRAEAILTILEGLPSRVQAQVLRELGSRIPPEARDRLAS
ncbi:hypothetical protein [Streptomyces sp. NPDC101132]|uniref:hypothetical protein n=1 Tax=Streptomyces sp. NPDC101132 TaxID=3366110 RepID=UPI003826D204